MRESEFNALIRLLEDDDPQVSTHVENQLLSMGSDAIPRLEEAWESIKDNTIQTRLEDIIQNIQSSAALSDLKKWRNEDSSDILKGWYLVSKFIYPEIEFRTFKNKISRLVNRSWLDMRRDMDISERLMVINRMLFSVEKFKANQRSLQDPDNYFINTFFDKKKGTPLSLGILYLIVCEQLEIPISGIVLPGYFVLLYKDDFNEFYVDVFNKGAFFFKKDLTRFLKEMELTDDPKYYVKTEKVDILLELIRSLIFSYRSKKDADKADLFEDLLREIEVNAPNAFIADADKTDFSGLIRIKGVFNNIRENPLYPCNPCPLRIAVANPRFTPEYPPFILLSW